MKENKQGAGPLPEMGCNEREKTLCLGVHLPRDTEGEGGSGGLVYLGAELGCSITASIIAA